MPTKDSKLANGLIGVDFNTVVKSAIFKEGKISSPIADGYFRVKYRISGQPVHYEIYYLDNLSFMPELTNKKPDLTGSCYEITTDEINTLVKSNTAIRFTTQVKIGQEDTFSFYIRSDDGSKLLIDNKLVIDNDGDHGVREKSGNIHLEKGKHKLEVLWFNGGGDGWLDVFVESSNMPKQILPTTMLKID